MVKMARAYGATQADNRWKQYVPEENKVLFSTEELAETASKSKLFFETSTNTTILVGLEFQLWR